MIFSGCSEWYRPPILPVLVVLIVEISYMPAQKLVLAASYDDWTST